MEHGAWSMECGVKSGVMVAVCCHGDGSQHGGGRAATRAFSLEIQRPPRGRQRWPGEGCHQERAATARRGGHRLLPTLTGGTTRPLLPDLHCHPTHSATQPSSPEIDSSTASLLDTDTHLFQCHSTTNTAKQMLMLQLNHIIKSS